MAEYIDKNKLNKKKKYLFQTKGMPFPKSEYFIKMDDFLSIPNADVIERSKIDKAIEEIKELYTEWENLSDDAKLESNPYGAVFNILQRNIGE